MAPASRTTKAAAGKKAASKKAAASTSAAAKTTKAPAPAVAARNGAATAPAKKAPAKKAPAKKAPAKKATGATAPANKAAATKAPATKAPAKTSAAKKSAATKAPAAKKAVRKRSPFSAAFLAQQKKLLIEERATYVHQADSLQAEADALVADFVSGDAQFDEDGGEGDTLSSERERDLALSAQARAAIEEIDHALAKFDLGTYGICEASGDPIPEERLEAIPWARVQVQYKTGGIGRP